MRVPAVKLSPLPIIRKARVEIVEIFIVLVATLGSDAALLNNGTVPNTLFDQSLIVTVAFTGVAPG